MRCAVGCARKLSGIGAQWRLCRTAYGPTRPGAISQVKAYQRLSTAMAAHLSLSVWQPSGHIVSLLGLVTSFGAASGVFCSGAVQCRIAHTTSTPGPGRNTPPKQFVAVVGNYVYPPFFQNLPLIRFIKGTGEASPVRGRDWAGFKFAAT